MNLLSEERFIMEKVTVNIEDISDAMKSAMDGWEQFLNIETGEIVSLSDGTWSDRDEEDESLAEEIDTTDKYVRIPNQ